MIDMSPAIHIQCVSLASTHTAHASLFTHARALYDGGTIVQVAASQLTSSKLWSALKPRALKPSTEPSPSICGERQKLVFINLSITTLHKNASISNQIGCCGYREKLT